MGDALTAPSPAESHCYTLTPNPPHHSLHRTAIRPKKISLTTMLATPNYHLCLNKLNPNLKLRTRNYLR